MQAHRGHGLYSQEESIQDAIERMIITIFYNEIALPIIDEGYDRSNVEAKVRQSMLAFLDGVFAASLDINGIKINNKVIDHSNCPERYKPLLALFEQMKRGEVDMSVVINGIMTLESFQQMNPVDRLCEMQGYVSAETIRKSFYNLMFKALKHSIKDGVITREDVEYMESEIFTRLPAITVFETLLRSAQAKSTGILLIDNATPVDLSNCPLTEDFPALVESMLNAKATLATLSEAQCAIVRKLVISGKDLTPEESSLRTESCQRVITAINHIGLIISQRKVFQQRITALLEAYLDIKRVSNDPGMPVPK